MISLVCRVSDLVAGQCDQPGGWWALGAFGRGDDREQGRPQGWSLPRSVPTGCQYSEVDKPG